MSMTPYIKSVSGLYRKLEREFYRAFQSRDRVHKSDHFLNFCITAHSLRDYYIESLKNPAPRHVQLLHKEWNRQPGLVAVREIANLSKHFVLRDRGTGRKRPPQIRGVRVASNLFVDVLQHQDDGRFAFRAVRGPDVFVRLSDGRRWDLFTFLDNVTEYWYTFLKSNGVRLRRPGIAELREKGT